MLTQPPTAQIGSLEIFWPLIEPILDGLAPQRICEVGVAAGALTERLLGWAERRHCAYVGIDPAPDAAIRERFAASGDTPGRRLLLQTSHAALPDLALCDVYFLDGDHNYFTVQGELNLIAGAIRTAEKDARGPVIFMHDVGWPWGRRDMYYLPTTLPVDARQPWSETLGVPLDGDELVEGGLREPGRYAIALRPGGPRNGVLTAVEDFLRGADGAGWESIFLPVAYGLAVLYRPADPTMPAECSRRLENLRNMSATGGTFLQACEENFLRLYLYGEFHRHAAATSLTSHHATLTAYDDLLAHSGAIESAYGKMETAYGKMENAYNDLLAHSHALEDEYKKLLTAYGQLREHADASVRSPQPPPPQDQFE